jgi:DNA-binding response OmpR family regulator
MTDSQLPELNRHYVRAVEESDVGWFEAHLAPDFLNTNPDRDAADSLGALLRMLGAEVKVVHDGQAALDAFGAFRPAVMFLDLGMPGIDGYEVARRIRGRSDAGGTSLIALTGWGQEKDR